MKPKCKTGLDSGSTTEKESSLLAHTLHYSSANVKLLLLITTDTAVSEDREEV